VTLLLSFYSSYGIVFAADSAITITDQGKTTRYGGAADPAQNKQEKLLELKPVGLNGAVVGFFGLAAVDEKRMDTWLREIFGPGWHGAASAAEVGDYLRDQLTVAVPKEQRESNPSGFHIGAFERRGGVDTPVMQYVSNIRCLKPSGDYAKFEEYRSEEHFPAHPNSASDFRHYPPSQVRDALRSLEQGQDFPHWFRNGDLAFGANPWAGLQMAARGIRQNLTQRGLASPDSIEDWERLAKLVVETAVSLYGIMGAKQHAPLIEGPCKSVRLPWPPDRHGN
jgi:hypothetical protein